LKFFKFILFTFFISFVILYSCATKEKIFKDFEKTVHQSISKDEIYLSTLFGKVIKTEENSLYVKLDKEKKKLLEKNVKNLDNYFLKVFKDNCLERRGKLDILDPILDRKLSYMIYNQLQSNDFPDIYLKEYLERDYKINFSILKKYYKLSEDIFMFCYLPEAKRFFAVSFDKKNDILKIFRGSVLKIIPEYAKEESEKLKRRIQEIINKDLENLVWFSLNLPLIYKGVKLYYFEARPVYETEEDKKANLGTDRWDVYLKFKNETFKPFILNLGNINLIKEGKDYKPLFKIDNKGNIKGIVISGDCQRVENNKVIISANGKCNIYYLYDRNKKEGGLKFLGLKNLKGAVLIMDKYPIYIWSMTTYDMKLEGLSTEEK